MMNEEKRESSLSNVEPIFSTMLMSDLHLEYSNTIIPDFPVLAPNLILAGDIGRPDIPSLERFLLAQSQRFEHIFYVAGNHCFYEGEYENRLEQLRQLDHLHPHIHFLQKKTYLLPNRVRILGTTLWSHVPSQTIDKIGQSLIDYRCISIVVKTKEGNEITRPITVDDTNQWHYQEHQWILKEIRQARENGEHVVIITHHAPSRQDTCSKEDEEAGLEDAYINDHDNDCQHPLTLWCYGHTHKSTDFTINSTRIISNPLGYYGEQCGFRPNMKITLFQDGSTKVTD